MKIDSDKPKLLGDFDSELSKKYDGLAAQEYYQMFPTSILHYINNNGGLKGKKAFDIGTGNGDLAQLLNESGATFVLGSDISDDQLDIAKDKYPTIELRNVNAYEVNVQPEAPFDVITCQYVFHFIPNMSTLIKACQNIFENLKEGGVAVFLDITHDYIFNKKNMDRLKAMTSYHYEPNVSEGEIPKAWSIVKGFVTTEEKQLKIDHFAVHGEIIMEVMKSVGFKSVERVPFVFHDTKVLELWGPDNLNHHLLVLKK